MKTKLFEMVRSTCQDIVEIAQRNAYEEAARPLKKAIYKLERQFQQAVHEGNLVMCGEIRHEVNVLKAELKNL